MEITQQLEARIAANLETIHRINQHPNGQSIRESAMADGARARVVECLRADLKQLDAIQGRSVSETTRGKTIGESLDLIDRSTLSSDDSRAVYYMQQLTRPSRFDLLAPGR
jgi:hypothetical protein